MKLLIKEPCPPDYLFGLYAVEVSVIMTEFRINAIDKTRGQRDLQTCIVRPKRTGNAESLNVTNGRRDDRDTMLGP